MPDLEKIKVEGKNFSGDVFFTKNLFKKLEKKKFKDGSLFFPQFKQGRAVRGMKHLFEKIKEKGYNLVLSDGPSKKDQKFIHINLNEYQQKGQNVFLSFYRDTGLKVAGSYLHDCFPSEYEKISDDEKTISKVEKNPELTIAKLKPTKRVKRAVIDKTKEFIQSLMDKKDLILQEVVELEEIKNKSAIGFYTTRLNELKNRLEKGGYTETSGKSSWQTWIYRNNRIFGNHYQEPIQKTKIGFDSIPDFLFPTLDGFLDILEIKKPDFEVIKEDPSHAGSYMWGTEVNKAIGQVVNYLSEIEMNQLQIQQKIKDKYEIDYFIIKPRAYILIGTEDETWTVKMRRAFRKLNYSLHGIEVITYSDLKRKAEKIIEMYSE